MKLLKLVLIALVTVGIYSFTTVEKTKDQPIDKVEKVSQYDGCFTLIYNPRTTPEERRLARLWVKYTYEIQLSHLKETSLVNRKIQEKWDFINIRTRVEVQDEDEDKEDDWKNANAYLHSYSIGCENSLTHIFE
ncbi:hypothetical protein [Tenacibaculum sp. 190524A05c]|uniref:hypothetical protein n=1 Tax=Tenacibaculum platacis TaxID=3137852 RepID=UPI0032B2A821